MAGEKILTAPKGTSWLSVLGGWIASVGTAALLAGPVAALLGGTRPDPDTIAPAVPVIVALMIAFLVGGYVAGRMAGYKTSWHGMISAFFGLFVVLGIALLGWSARDGAIAGIPLATPATLFPGVDLYQVGNALTFGALIGFLAAIFAGWLGGLLAPSRYAMAMRHVPDADVPQGERTAARRRGGFRLLPALGRKGGERHDEPVASGDRRD